MDRRAFLGTMTAATVFARQFAWAQMTHKIEKVGVQLYTVRSVMKEDFEGKLAKVAEIGYREVEFAGYDDHTPQEVRAMLDRHGLTGPSAHVPYKSLGDEIGRACSMRPTWSAINIWSIRISTTMFARARRLEARGRNVQSRRGGQPEGGNSVRVSQSLVRICPGQRKTSLRHSAGRVRSQAGEDGNGPVLDLWWAGRIR